MTVHFFHGPYRFLSNFYLSTIHWERRSYPTAEHLFQARKTTNEVDHEWVREAPSVSGAKHRGRRVTCRPGWNDIRIDVMREVLEAKFSQHPNLAKKLLETGDQELIEGNFWGDTFWGVYLGSGQNNLGKLLMELRSKTSVYAPRMTSIFSFGSKPELFLRVGMQATLSSRLAVAEALIHRIRHGGDQTFVLEGSLSEEQLKYQTLSGRELKTDYLTHLIYGQIPVIRVWLVREALFDLGVQETLTQALL